MFDDSETIHSLSRSDFDLDTTKFSKNKNITAEQFQVKNGVFLNRLRHTAAGRSCS